MWSLEVYTRRLFFLHISICSHHIPLFHGSNNISQNIESFIVLTANKIPPEFTITSHNTNKHGFITLYVVGTRRTMFNIILSSVYTVSLCALEFRSVHMLLTRFGKFVLRFRKFGCLFAVPKNRHVH